ncbi:mediator of RNA polymerase II transcription subunit 6 [[Candida] anglica]|uniref:Mediator of RNA polymerase II transcription subunit 6 n=1 Tax=[Candida] anglica TaxID=148631 RepID=A0ABP0EL59_9ASCO
MAKSEPLDEIQWKSPEWIQQFGLHTQNVLDYFSESPFYDRTSNNQVIKMQLQFQTVPLNVHPQTYIESKLLEMVGIEFAIVHVKEPGFWIIRKQNRLSPTSTIVQQDYYIIGANIYQAPKVYDILSSRLLSSIRSVKSSLDLLNKLSNYDVGYGGHSYPSINDRSNIDQSVTMTNTNTVANTVANTATPMIMTPSIGTGGNIGGNNAATNSASNTNINTVINPNIANNSTINKISSSTFDGLLSSVMNSAEQGTYLDDIPLYGKGSTVERMDLKINLEDDDE